jgi:hypothetical protein
MSVGGDPSADSTGGKPEGRASGRPLAEKEGGHPKGPAEMLNALPFCGISVGAGASPGGLENDVGQSVGLPEKTGAGITAAQAS